ncbi:MAG: DUF3148 domain-containing protein [Spirulinaceae cyanobacterium RM2_2_10]|nr:DUF3148 domain-containing protein [Spirulinaceae cyanobacterium SM2_1_0]NJO20337.1 DUF3148 domain-containing protein [Spirulinaceae cyanobacterium RM2_2_10]
MSEPEFALGAKVRLTTSPQYFKTADPMPMLRPPNVVRVGEEGRVLARRPGGYWAVKFERGAFLVENKYIEMVLPHTDRPAARDEEAD